MRRGVLPSLKARATAREVLWRGARRSDTPLPVPRALLASDANIEFATTAPLREAATRCTRLREFASVLQAASSVLL